MSEILVFSTGVIGERIKYKNICESIPKLYSSLKGRQLGKFFKINNDD